MTRAWGRCLTRISFGLGCGFLLTIAVAIALLSTGKLEVALLSAWAISEPLFSNTRPPVIADGLFKSWDWRMNWRDEDAQFATILEREFPVGTSEAQLKSTLLAQGFKPPPPSRHDCLPQGQPAPIGKMVFRCPTHDLSRELRYEWSRFPCGQQIVVWWTPGDKGDITEVKGVHGGGCL
jgi:hypothetical protein